MRSAQGTRRHLCAASATSAPPSRAPTTRCTRPSWRRSTARASSSGRRRRSTSCPTASSTRRGVRGRGHRADRAHGPEQRQPRVDLHLVGRQRAGRQHDNERRRDRPRARPLSSARRPRAVRKLDDTRFVAIDRQSRIDEAIDQPGLPRPRRARRQRVLRLVPSITAGTPGARAHAGRPRALPRRAAHRLNPRLPLMITEFGAEGARSGPITQKGTLRVPDQVHRRPPGRPRLQALRERVDPLGAARLPRHAQVARRGADELGHAALAQQEPDRGDRRGQAAVLRAAAALPQGQAAALMPSGPCV